VLLRYLYNSTNEGVVKMRAERRPNGSTPHPAMSYRLPVEVKQMLSELAEKNEKNTTQMIITLIKGSHARTKL
jgi:predicted transcriptional regulator